MFLLYPNFEDFYHEKILYFVKCFESIEMIISLLSFILLLWCITFIYLHILNQLCIPEINPTWSWCINWLICCWIWFPCSLLRNYWPVSGILVYYFLVVSLFYWHQGKACLLKWVWKCFQLFNLLEDSEKNCC